MEYKALHEHLDKIVNITGLVLEEGWGRTTMEYKTLHEHFDKIVDIIFSSSLEPHWIMELLLFLCLLLSALLLCWMLVAALTVHVSATGDCDGTANVPDSSSRKWC